MDASLVDKSVRHIIELSRHHDLEAIDMNGHGETTITDTWVDASRTLLTAGLRIRITSNFAKEFSDDELSVLARMDSIAISIDTAERPLLRRMRRKVDVRQIVTNITMVRAKARALHHKSPPFHFLCGLYDRNSLLVEGFAHLAIALGITNVGFWSLTPYPYETSDVLEADRVFPLDDLTDDDLLPRIEAIRRAIAVLKHAGIVVEVQADFVNVLAARRGFRQ